MNEKQLNNSCLDQLPHYRGPLGKRENHKDSNDVSCLNYIIHYANIYNSYSRFPEVSITHLEISPEEWLITNL